MKSASRWLLLLSVAACKNDVHAERDDPTRCQTCHMPEFETTKHPPHVDARPTTCGVCHTQKEWHRWRVEHPWWELTGAHARAAADEKLAGKENQVKCFWCHRGDPATWKDTKKECIACHEEDRSLSHFPDHETFQDTCQDCHSTDAWKPAKRPVRLEPDPSARSDDAGAPQPPTNEKPTAPKPKPKPKPLPSVSTTAQPHPPDVVTRPSRHR